ncbi:MAG: Mut7-C RNAse domain-containing protein [Thermoplasmata archaeon]
MKFVTDHMLGRLAKFLRFLGYDTIYPDFSYDDDSIINLAKSENGILLSRDKEICSRYEKSFLIKSEDYIEQLKEVIKEFKLDNKNMLTRCSICNVPLINIEKEKVIGKVPENVYNTHDEFYMCPSCGRIYWMGSHTKNIIERLEEVLNIENR